MWLGLPTKILLQYVDSEKAIASFPGSQTGTKHAKKAGKTVLSKELHVVAFKATTYIMRFGK